MKIKVSDLEDEQLAEWMARAQEWTLFDDEVHGLVWINDADEIMEYVEDYRPDINGTQAMELKKRFKISDTFTLGGKWHASVVAGVDEYSGYPDDFVEQLGDTPEIAITRAAIASVYGETVTVEDE